MNRFGVWVLAVGLAAWSAAGCGSPSGRAAGTAETAAAADGVGSARAPAADSGRVEAAPAPVRAPAPIPVLAANERLVAVEVGGMVCEACVVLVGRQLQAVPGVRTVSGDLASQTFQVACDRAVADTSLTAAVRRAGSHYLGMVVEK